MNWSNLRFNVEVLLLAWQQIYHLAFLVNFRTTPEVSSKLYFLITKELIFGFQILDLKDHFSASLITRQEKRYYT